MISQKLQFSSALQRLVDAVDLGVLEEPLGVGGAGTVELVAHGVPGSRERAGDHAGAAPTRTEDQAIAHTRASVGGARVLVGPGGGYSVPRQAVSVRA